MEIWKEVVGYEGIYQVSNLGRIKSLKFGKEKILKKTIDNRGYYVVNLHINRKQKTFNVHQIVASSFLNHKPNGYEFVVDHINDDKLNNQVSNLQIVTARFNVFKTQGKYSSQYKGIYLNKRFNKWLAQIYINGKRKHLGYFTNEYDAHIAYENALANL
jgi:hypothetical protein